jgi:hypothetical protein
MFYVNAPASVINISTSKNNSPVLEQSKKVQGWRNEADLADYL